jgi:hypothetical protein
MNLEMKLRRVNDQLTAILLSKLHKLLIRYLKIMIEKLQGIFNLKLKRVEVNYREKLKIRYNKVFLSNLI